MKEHKEADAAVLRSRPSRPLQVLGPVSQCRLLFVFSFKEKKLFLKNKRKYEITKYLNFLTFIFKVDDYRCY